MQKKTIFLSLLIAIVFAGYYFGFERCQDQLAYDYSPYCVKCNEQNAEKGDPGSAYNLALYFEGRDPVKSNDWLRTAAERGDRRAVSRALDECGDGKQFSPRSAEKILSDVVAKDPQAMSLEAMYFYLGGYCGPINLELVRTFYVKRADDDLILCRVALKYGEVVRSGMAKDSDQKNVIELLQECMRKSDPDSVTYQDASKLLGALRP